MTPQCRLKSSLQSVEEAFTCFKQQTSEKKSSLPNTGLMKNMACKFRHRLELFRLRFCLNLAK